MIVRTRTSGDRTAADRMRRRAQVELATLQRVMAQAEEPLNQGRRQVFFNNGAIITCQVLFGQAVVDIHVPPGAPPAPEVAREQMDICWCTACFAAGRVKRVIGTYGDVGDYGETPYPAAVNATHADVKGYTGIRYEVAVCQRLTTGPFICIPGDFAAYAPGDAVGCLFMGLWSNVVPFARILPRCWSCATGPCKEAAERFCEPCEANRRPGQTGDEPDGSFILVPLKGVAL